jgi:hypothetical protein
MCEWCTLHTDPYTSVAFHSTDLVDPSVQTCYSTADEPNLCVILPYTGSRR